MPVRAKGHHACFLHVQDTAHNKLWGHLPASGELHAGDDEKEKSGMRRLEYHFPRTKSLGVPLCTVLTSSLPGAGGIRYDATIDLDTYSGTGIQPTIPSQSSR